MDTALKIKQDGALDFLSLGALVHRLDPGIIPFRKAIVVRRSTSAAASSTCAANLADCFGLHTGIATAMVDYPIGDLIAERVRGDGRDAVLQEVQARRRARARTWPPSTATAATACAPRSCSTTARNEAAAQLKPGDFDWNAIFGGGVRWFHSGGIFAALSETTAELIIEAMQAAKAAGAVVSFDLNYREKLWNVSGGARARRVGARPHRRERRRAGRQRRGPAEGPRHRRAGSGRRSRSSIRARSSA